MRPVQAWARRNRLKFFLPYLADGDRVLEIGPGEGWFRQATEAARRLDYITIDTDAPADIDGDIREWRRHGLTPASFDKIVAFEVVEHVDCFADCCELLQPDGLLLLTTPMPHFDWVLKLLEAAGLTQKRTSPHSNLVYVKNIPGFQRERVRFPFGLGQWVILRKIAHASS